MACSSSEYPMLSTELRERRLSRACSLKSDWSARRRTSTIGSRRRPSYYESGGWRFESFRARHGRFSPRQIRKNLIINRFESCRWYQSVGSEDMRAMNGVSKNRHGVYYVRKKVPKRLEQPTAEFLGNGKSRQTFLKRSLDTKDLREANIRAKPVLIEVDRILAQAEALTIQRPMRTAMGKREIDQITSYFYAYQLAADDEDRREGGSEQLFQSMAQQLSANGIEYTTPYQIGDPPKFGLSDREMQKRAETPALTLPLQKRRLHEATSPSFDGKLMNC